MIKLETKNGNFRELEVSGNIVEITADLFTTVRKIWGKLPDGEVKDTYKRIMVEGISTVFLSEEEIEKLANEVENEKNDKIDELIESLNKLNDLVEEILSEDETVGNEA